MEGKLILSEQGFELTLERLAHQLIEDFDDFDNVCMIGIQESGVTLAEQLFTRIKQINKKQTPEFGKLDITFYRDDYRHKEKPLKASATEITFLIENKTVILVDDVLYTGRTVHAAISALQDFGRPKAVKMLCLVDRRFNRHFPISSDYYGITVDALDNAFVKVHWLDQGKGKIVMNSPSNIKS